MLSRLIDGLIHFLGGCTKDELYQSLAEQLKSDVDNARLAHISDLKEAARTAREQAEKEFLGLRSQQEAPIPISQMPFPRLRRKLEERDRIQHERDMDAKQNYWLNKGAVNETKEVG